MSEIAQIMQIISFVIGVITAIIVFFLFMRYFKKKQVTTLLLATSMAFSSVMGFLASGTYTIAPVDIEFALLFQKVAYLCTFLATIFIFLFASRIFFHLKRPYIILYALAGLAIGLIIVSTNSSDVVPFPDDPTFPAISLKTVYGILMVLYFIPTHLGIFSLAWKTSNKLDESQGREYKVGYKLIAVGELLVVLAGVSDTLSGIFIGDVEIYPYFAYLLWILAVLSSFIQYLGWILPTWFRKLIHFERVKA